MPETRRLEYVPLDELIPADRNPKAHDDELIGRSIRRFGFVETPVIDERTGKLVAGHGRTDDLRRRADAGESPPDGVSADDDGRWLVPVLRGWSSRDDDEALAAGIALNRTGEGGVDYTELLPMLEDFVLRSVDDDTDLLSGIGFDADDLTRILAEVEFGKREDGEARATQHRGGEQLRTPKPGEEYSQRGDVWTCGDHRVMCGDCRDQADVATLLEADRVNVAFTSPPYAEQRNYDASSGFLPIAPERYVDWFAPVAALVAHYLADDGSWFVNIKPSVSEALDTQLYVFDLVVAHVRAWGWHFATEFCWERTGVPKSVKRRFKNQFEPVYQFARGDWKMRPDAVRVPSDNVPQPLGPGHSREERDDLSGIYRIYGDPNEWQGATPARGYTGNMSAAQGADRPAPGETIAPGYAYPGNRLPTFGSTHEATGHAAAFPVGLPAWFVRAYSDRGDVVYDPFLGSGSTVVAAQEEGRLGRGMELSPGYVDVAMARLQRATGVLPVNSRTGEAVDVHARVATAADAPPERGPDDGLGP